MSYKRWLSLFLSTFLFLMLLVMYLIYYIDPYQFFNKHSHGFSNNQRYQNLGLINSYLNSNDGYDSILIGTSLEENFYPTDIQEKMKWGKVLKLCASGAVPLEQNTILDKAMQTGKVKNVLWEIAIHKFSVDRLQESDKVHTMPFDLYQKYTGSFIYLLNRHIVEEGFRLYFQNKEYPQHDLEKLGNWQSIFQKYFEAFGSYDNLLKLGSMIDEKELDTKNKALKVVDDYPEIDYHLLPMIQKYPDVNFVLFIPPYSKAYYLDRDNKELSRDVMMAYYLVRKLSKCRNVRLYGFDTDDFTENLTNYRDKVHYSENINKLIIFNISKNMNRLLEENITEYIDIFTKKIYDYQEYLYKLNSNAKNISKMRLEDLNMIKIALEKYHKDNGSYPISQGFDGLYTKWGKQGVNWIEGLTPKYIKFLPRDPRKLDDPNKQYYYKSNGRDYKLIGHGVEDCNKVQSKYPELIDQKRNCWAYGFWTEDAKLW